MDEDYASAARRHLDDARTLLAASRPDNAGYLAGYVAECGLKAIITRAGFRVRFHIDRFPARALTLAADLSAAARRYPVDLNADLALIRHDWATSFRYAPTGTVTRSRAESLVSSADAVFTNTVISLVLDGYLERMPA